MAYGELCPLNLKSEKEKFLNAWDVYEKGKRSGLTPGLPDDPQFSYADPEAARAYLLQTIALGQCVDEAYYYLGRMAEEDNNAEEALSWYMQIGFGPEYLAANNRIGQILIESDQLERSHAWFV